MGKAEENKKIKRSALLSHAFSLFLNNGIANTSISDITSNAGVAKGTFYSYFTDKEDLIQKLVSQKCHQLLKNSVEELHKQDEMSVEDSIIFISEDLILQLSRDPKLLRFINKNLSSGYFKKIIASDNLSDDLSDSEFDMLESLHAIIRKDGYQWDNPLLMLYTIVELISSTCHTILLYGEPVNYETYKPYLTKCIRNIITVFRVEN